MPTQFPAVIELSGLYGSNGFKINGIAAGDLNGWSVSYAGDINADGVADLIIGSPGADPYGYGSSQSIGQSYVVFGGDDIGSVGINLSNLDGSNGFIINGIGLFDKTGQSVSNAGDINADGVDDLIIGAPGASQSYVVFGGNGIGSSGILNLLTLSSSKGFKLFSSSSTTVASGWSVSYVGDINADGLDDLIVGDYAAYPIGLSLYYGESYVVFGGPGIGSGGALNLADLNGSNGFKLKGIAAGDRSGWSVSNAGDINADGVSDLIIGAPFASSNGASYVVFGGPGVGSSGTLNLGSLNGNNGFKLNGISAGAYSGISVNAAGDINADGVDDLLIGSLAANPNGLYAGQSYVVFGGPGVGSSGTLNLGSLNGNNGFKLNGISALDYSGRSVSAAGDINADGVDDLIIGANRADPNGVDSGQCYVVFGGPGVGSSGTIELSSLNGSNGFKLNGIVTSEEAGYSVSAVRDINNDGADDIIIGAPKADVFGSDNGRSYVVFGDGIRIINNQLTISEGQSVVVNDVHLKAIPVWSDPNDWTFMVNNTRHGQFESVFDPGVPITTFSPQQITNTEIRFVHDGSELSPSYDIGMSSPSLRAMESRRRRRVGYCLAVKPF